MTAPSLPVRHIDPNDLADAEWDRLMTDPTPETLAPRIGTHVADMDNIIWRVDGARSTAHDFAIYLGRPVASTGPGGAAVILTADLKFYMDRFRRSPDLIDLPVGRTVIKRLRRALGHHWYEDGERWWLQRMDDLLTLTTADFAVRHGVKVEAVTYARLNFVGPRQRAAYWWRDLRTADLILSPQPRLYVAQMLDISVSSLGRLKAQLRREVGMPMDKAAAVERMREAKTGIAAHPNTKAALLDAAKRPKSPEWRAQLSDRNRQRDRPASWVEREWTAEQEALLGTMPDRQCAERLGRTIDAVRSRRRAIGVSAFSGGAA